MKNRAHFTSYHSYLGVITLIVFLTNHIFGITGHYFKAYAPKGLLKLHKRIGSIAFLVGISTVFSAFYFGYTGMGLVQQLIVVSLFVLLALKILKKL